MKLACARFAIAVLTAAFSVTSFANPVIPIPTTPQTPTFSPNAPNLDASSYLLMDSSSGEILAEKNSDQRVPPASLTKLMTMYLVSAALKSGQLHLDDKVRVSSKAWKTEGSRMFIKVDDEVPVKELIQGVVVASGNDATVALAEHLAGTEEAFTSLMNQQAQALGMKNTHFMDSTGLPNKEHYSTAHDMAVLARAYINAFPEDYSLYGEKWYSYNGIRQPNRNRLLWRYQYADGLKTGHTNEAGFCLVASAKKDGMRLISVILGAPSDQMRTEDSIRLLTYGFRFFETHKIYNAQAPVVTARVWGGSKADTPLGFQQDMYVTVPTGQYKKLQASLDLNNPIKAPVALGQPCGTLNIKLNGKVITSKPLLALTENPKGSLWRRAADSISFNFHKYFSHADEKVNTG